MMKRTDAMGGLSAVSLVLAFAASAHAVPILTIVPPDQQATLGEPVSVDVVVSNLMGVEIGSYDLDISFNEHVLALTTVDQSEVLGIPVLEAEYGATFSGDLADLFGVSFLTTAELDAIQGDSVVLATFTFLPIANGVSSIAFSQALVANAAGGELSLVMSEGRVRIGAVPEPGELLLLAMGVVALSRRIALRSRGY